MKPAREVKVGDQLRVTNDGGDFEIEVLGLSEVRGPAPVAQALYRESEESKAARAKARKNEKRIATTLRHPIGRPSKRDRRRIIQFRGGR